MTGLCRPSRRDEAPQLARLWKVCFGDTDDYIAHYFSAYYRPDRAPVLEDGGAICSMLLTFPNVLVTGEGQEVPACYIYAFCTAPEARSRGYGRRLLAWAEEQAARQGCHLTVMVPGEASLFDFYETLGYRTVFFHREQIFTQTGPANGTLAPCDGAAYAARREALLAGRPHMAYPLEVLEYQRSLCHRTGGGFFLWKDSLAAVETDGETLYCKELLTAYPQAAVNALLTHFGMDCAVVRTPAGPADGAKGFAVAKSLVPCGDGQVEPAGYLAFAFD
ncbi:MAG: GNAT family N-acetyltransferase [Clostridiales bacterium]|nr:GNAT family N-acetyltransferase [Clostridiales bacterium]